MNVKANTGMQQQYRQFGLRGRCQHIAWECRRLEAVLDRTSKPSSPFVARFGRKLKSVSNEDIAKMRRHLCRYQQRLWEATPAAAPEES